MHGQQKIKKKMNL